MIIDKHEIKERLSLTAVVELCTGEPIPHSGLIVCPFHDDHHPSCKIYPDHWYCFGCHKHGDVIQWVSEWECTDFQHALELCSELLHSN